MVFGVGLVCIFVSGFLTMWALLAYPSIFYEVNGFNAAVFGSLGRDVVLWVLYTYVLRVAVYVAYSYAVYRFSHIRIVMYVYAVLVISFVYDALNDVLVFVSSVCC
jgi:hypothetical protein